MNKRYAIIENDVVVNIAVSEAALASNWIEIDPKQAQIGWSYINGVFSPPPPPPVVPAE
jgi:hypothetical protein